MILPMNQTSVRELASLPVHSGDIPTAQVKLEDPQVADFAVWLDDQLADLEWQHREAWTHNSTLDALFSGTKSR
ncbi:MAG TPA: hypothetical protein VL096_21760 [Pirellulaceae bacterium]|nr:hypothetical protein [Pirellulaceae bacterium]